MLHKTNVSKFSYRTAGNHAIHNIYHVDKMSQYTDIFVELEVLFLSFLLKRTLYMRLDRHIMCGNCILFELMKCLDSRLFRFRKHFNVLLKKSVALHTLENIWPKSSDSENYVY